MMRLLITNDDGIYATGIISLAKRCYDAGHEVTVIAPDRERSACAHSMTMDFPLSLKAVEIGDYEGMSAYSLNGTPADCVKIAVSHVLNEKPDVVLSGINNGSNLGSDIVYSGTVNAALEACMLGCPAIAVSQAFGTERIEFAEKRALRFWDSAGLAVQFLDQTDVSKLNGFIYNINFPSAPVNEIKGIKMCVQGICDYDEAFEKRIDPFGREYYWVSGALQHNPFNDEQQTDVKWLRENYVTVTPLRWNQTENEVLEREKCKIDSMKLHS